MIDKDKIMSPFNLGWPEFCGKLAGDGYDGTEPPRCDGCLTLADGGINPMAHPDLNANF